MPSAMTPYADCETCWGAGIVYWNGPYPAKVWVRGKGWVETSWVPCPDCNAERNKVERLVAG